MVARIGLVLSVVAWGVGQSWGMVGTAPFAAVGFETNGWFCTAFDIPVPFDWEFRTTPADGFNHLAWCFTYPNEFTTDGETVGQSVVGLLD
jgi:hypothetical protein